MIEWLSNKTANKIKNTNPDNTSSIEVLVYGLKIIYNTSIIILLSTIYGLFIGNVYDIIVALVAFAVLRFFTGGHHVSSSDLCVLITVGLVIVISQVDLNYVSSWMLNLFSLILIFAFSPYKVEPHIELFKKMVQYFKYIAFAIIVSNLFIFNSDVLTLVYFAQSLTLIHFNLRGERV